MTENEWEKILIQWMTSRGWVNDRNDEKTLGFSFKEKEHHWIRDYDKKNRSYVHYDGNTRVSFKVSK